MIENYRRGRFVEYMARDHLRKAGCTTVRSAGSRSPVDLIAWSESVMRFIQVKRTQQFVGGVQMAATMYRQEIKRLQALPKPQFPGSKIQLWVFVADGTWRCFDVLPGGIQEVGMDD